MADPPNIRNPAARTGHAAARVTSSDATGMSMNMRRGGLTTTGQSSVKARRGAPCMSPWRWLAVCLIVTLLPSTATAQALNSITPVNGANVVAGSYNIERDSAVDFLFFGTGLDAVTSVTFTTSATSCVERDDAADISGQSPTQLSAAVTITQTSLLYICLDDTHQGTAPYLTLTTFTEAGPLFPTWVSVVLLIILLVLSGIFSGLNLGLMALDTTELQIVKEVGDEGDKHNAQTIYPVRQRGNLLLCTLLLGNVLVNSTLTILLDSLAGGFGAVFGSTAGIVVFGEILPQSICSRHGLYVGAKTIWITKLFMFLTFPIAYPISLILDFVLGDEIGAVYQRKQLLQLIRLTDQYNDLARDEVDIITGALTYKEKTVEMVMTPIDDRSEAVLLTKARLHIDSVLNFKTMTRIMDSGHSRIPAYGQSRDEIVGVLFVKDLAFIDPDDNTPLNSVLKFYNHEMREVYHDMRLDSMLDEFKKGSTHLCLVMKVTSEGDKDPERHVIGIVTLEDVIEEIIQTEIIDETDRFVDNKTKMLVERPEREVLQLALSQHPAKAPQEVKLVSEQMSLAALTFLSTTVPALDEAIVSRTVLQRLMNMPSTSKELIKEELADDERFLYRFNQPTTFFTLILEGRYRVQVGKDRFSFEAGPFSTLALGVLNQTGYVADFSAELVSERALIIQISRKQYIDACATTRRGTVTASSGNLSHPPNMMTASPLLERFRAGSNASTTSSAADLAAESAAEAERKTESLV